MKTIASLEKKLSSLRTELALCNSADHAERKAELEEKIDFIQDEVDELEEAEQDNAAYEEMTGTTPQDLYIERNRYAICQGEAIERFRNEY
jgi:hypothetical protein